MMPNEAEHRRLLHIAEAFANQYEFDDGEGGSHTPSAFERVMLIDMINGLFADDDFQAAIAARAAAEPEPVGEAEIWCRLMGRAVDALDQLSGWEATEDDEDTAGKMADFADSAAAEIRAAYPSQPPTEPQFQCSGCGCTWTDEELKARRQKNPRLLSCCPERRLVPRLKAVPTSELTSLVAAARNIHDKCASETGTVTIFDQERLRECLEAFDRLTLRPVLFEEVRMVRHLKRNSTYDVLGDAEVQISTRDGMPASSRPLHEGDRLTVYRAHENGKLYLRFPDEFADGRFREIPAHIKETENDLA